MFVVPKPDLKKFPNSYLFMPTIPFFIHVFFSPPFLLSFFPFPYLLPFFFPPLLKSFPTLPSKSTDSFKGSSSLFSFLMREVVSSSLVIDRSAVMISRDSKSIFLCLAREGNSEGKIQK